MTNDTPRLFKRNILDSILDSPDPSSAAFLSDLYKKIAISADSVARAVLYAIEQPADVEIDEVVLREPMRVGTAATTWAALLSSGLAAGHLQNRSLADSDLDAFVDGLATRIASFDKQAISETKRFVDAVADLDYSVLTSFLSSGAAHAWRPGLWPPGPPTHVDPHPRAS